MKPGRLTAVQASYLIQIMKAKQLRSLCRKKLLQRHTHHSYPDNKQQRHRNRTLYGHADENLILLLQHRSLRSAKLSGTVMKIKSKNQLHQKAAASEITFFWSRIVNHWHEGWVLATHVPTYQISQCKFRIVVKLFLFIKDEKISNVWCGRKQRDEQTPPLLSLSHICPL